MQGSSSSRRVVPLMGQPGVRVVRIAEALRLATDLPSFSTRMPRSVAAWFGRMEGRLALLAARRRAEAEGVEAPSWTTMKYG